MHKPGKKIELWIKTGFNSIVGANEGNGDNTVAQADKVVPYSGKKLAVKFLSFLGSILVKTVIGSKVVLKFKFQY